MSKISNQMLSYNNTIFYSITNQMAYGGDINFNNGTGGESIYGLNFADENFILKHQKKYLLSMTNSGPNQNSSKFFITLAPAQYLDNKHVVFGEVIEGKHIVDLLGQISTYHGTPMQ